MDPNADFTKNPIFTEQYWRRPKIENKGDANCADIYTAVGFALSNWEMAEEELARLFLALVEAEHPSASPTRRAYGAIGSSAGRRKAIEAAAEAYFGPHWENPTVYKSFFAIINASQWGSKRRDDFAHGIALGQVLDGVNYGAFLFPPDYNTERTTPFLYPEKGDPLFFKAAKYRYTSTQVWEFGHKFLQLQEAIQRHAALITKDHRGTIIFVRAVTGGSVLGL